jgi:putative phosphoesterase
MSDSFVLKGKVTVGVISDTHGMLRNEAVEAFKGAGLIIHAGDIGNPSVLDALRKLAPVIAVRGNMDGGAWASGLRRSEIIEVEEGLIYVIHDIGRMDMDPSAAGIKTVVFGHSHRPTVKTNRGVLYLNPGSAGPHRYTLPVSVALLEINGGSFDARIIKLNF